MVKLKALSFKKIDDIPDHLLQEMQNFAIRLTLGVKMYVECEQPNIALAGLNWMLPCILKFLVNNDPDELRKASKMSCVMILDNMEILIKEMEKEKNES